jgi:hypothetical protein
MSFVLLTACFLGPECVGQERIPQEESERYAKILTAEAEKITDAPIKVKGDPTKAVGLRHEEHGGMIIPESELTVEKLKELPKEGLPIGQLWLRRLTPQVAGASVPDTALRQVQVLIDDADVKLPVFLLAIVKAPDGKLELLAYGADKMPTLKLELKKLDDGAAITLPIELEGKSNGDDTGTLTLNILGRYQAEVIVTATPE